MNCCEVEEKRDSLIENMHSMTEEINLINACVDNIALALFDLKAASTDEIKVCCFQDELRMNHSRLIDIRGKISEIEKRITK